MSTGVDYLGHGAVKATEGPPVNPSGRKYPYELDSEGKAKSIPVWRFTNPHMGAFHVSKPALAPTDRPRLLADDLSQLTLVDDVEPRTETALASLLSSPSSLLCGTAQPSARLESVLDI